MNIRVSVVANVGNFGAKFFVVYQPLSGANFPPERRLAAARILKEWIAFCTGLQQQEPAAGRPAFVRNAESNRRKWVGSAANPDC